MEYIYGKNSIISYLEENLLKEVYLPYNYKDEAILSKLREKHVKITFKDRKVLDSINPKNQGFIGLIEGFKYATLEDIKEVCKNKDNAFILMLDRIEDPHNFGAIIRTCEAFGVDGIIVSKHESCPLNATVVKASTGTLANVKVCQVVNLTKTIDELKKEGFWVVAAEANNSQDYRLIDYHMKTILIMGSEGFGIAPLVKKQADFNAFIPMVGKVNSLNVSVATAILVSHISLNNK